MTLLRGMMVLARKKGEEKIFAVSENETYEIIPVASELNQLVSFLDEVKNSHYFSATSKNVFIISINPRCS